MKKMNLAVVIRDEYYYSIYMDDKGRQVSVYPEGIREMKCYTFPSEKDIDAFFGKMVEDIKCRVPYFQEEYSTEYEIHWLFSLNPGEYYLGFWEKEWEEQARELGEVFQEADALKACAEVEGQNGKNDYVDFCWELVLQAARGLLYIGQRRERL